MYIGEIGTKFNTTIEIDYSSDRTFIEFDAIIIDYENIISHHKVHNEKLFLRRKEALNEFLSHKDVPLLIFSPTPVKLEFHSPGRIHRDLSYLLPVPEFDVANETGEKININPKTIFSDFLNKYKNHFYYKAIFTKAQGIVIAETPLTKKILAFYNDQSVFLPRLKLNKLNEEEFLRDLIEILKKVRYNNEQSKLPAWTKQYNLPNEEILKSEIADIRRQIEEQKLLLTIKQDALQMYDGKKVLFTGSGNELEREVEAIFRELGFEIIEADRNRDDLIVKYQNRIAVVEIKGVNSSAAEKHAAQLEKWVAGYLELNDRTLTFSNTHTQFFSISNRNLQPCKTI
jgi:hypothetical protein